MPGRTWADTSDSVADRILAHEAVAKAILVDLPAALRADGLAGLEEALAAAGRLLTANRSLDIEGEPT